MKSTIALAAALTILVSALVQAQALRQVVGEPLKNAVKLANASAFDEAEAKVKAADAAPNKTNYEVNAIAQVKIFIATKKAQAGKPKP